LVQWEDLHHLPKTVPGGEWVPPPIQPQITPLHRKKTTQSDPTGTTKGSRDLDPSGRLTNHDGKVPFVQGEDLHHLPRPFQVVEWAYHQIQPQQHPTQKTTHKVIQQAPIWFQGLQTQVERLTNHEE
jgi:hypothetical protein